MASCRHCHATLPDLGSLPGRYCAACGAALFDDPAATAPPPPDDPAATVPPPADDPAATGPMPARATAGSGGGRAGAAATATQAASAATTRRTLAAPSATSRGDDPSASWLRALGTGGLRGGRLAAFTVAIAVASSGGTRLVERALRTGSKPPPPAPAATSSPSAPPRTAGAPAVESTPIELPGQRRARSSAGSRARSVSSEIVVTVGSRPTMSGAVGAVPSAAAGSGAAVRDRTDVPPEPPAATSPASAPVAGAHPAGAGATGSPVTDTAPGAATPPPPPQLFLGDTTGEEAPPTAEDLTEGREAALYASAIRYVARSHEAQIRACYERVAKDEEAATGGRVEVGFTVTADGRARGVQVVSNSTGKDALGACLTQRVAEWKFPRPPAGEFQASYPFIFSGAR